MLMRATGCRAGKTFTWRAHAASDVEFAFVDGIHNINYVPENEMSGIARYLAVNLQCVPHHPQHSAPLGQDGAEPPVPVVETNPIRLAILDLDPENDDHWTAEGTAQVAAVAITIPSITRRAIDHAAPDLNRAAVRQQHAAGR
jgi:hypothetical protein